MNWRQRIAVLLLVLLAGTPAIGVVCGLSCTTATIEEAHHGAAACEETMDPPAEEGISASAAHSCDGHSGGALLMATAAERADLRRTAVLRVIVAVPTVELTFRQRLTETWFARPGNDPPVVPPLVRRI